MNIQEKIDLYVKGELPEDEIDSLWVEIAKEPELMESLELEATVREVILEKYGRKAAVKTMPKWIWHASAAAAILVVAFVQLFKVDTPTEIADFLAQDITLNQIESSDTFRNSGSLVYADSLLSAGSELIYSGDISSATELLESISQNMDSLVYAKAQLNLGIINYINQHFEVSEVNFRQASSFSLDTGRVKEKSLWYLSNSLVQQEKLEEARQQLSKAYSLDGIYKDEIYLMLRKLDYDLGYNKPDSIQE